MANKKKKISPQVKAKRKERAEVMRLKYSQEPEHLTRYNFEGSE